MTPPPLPTVAAAPDASAKRRASRRAVLRLALITLLTLAGAAVLFLHDPTAAAGKTSYYPPCPLNRMTGLYCPGCGTTRGLHHLLHGRLATAFDYNPLMVVSLPFVGYALGRIAGRTVWPDRFPPRRPLPARWVWAILFVVITFGVLRNLSYRPVAWMAP